MKKNLFWIRVLLSSGLIIFLFYTVNMQDILSIAARSNPIYLLLALLIALGDRVLMAYKWNILLRAKCIRIPLLNITGTYLITTFLGLFLPATVGGDALRAYAVAKDGHKASDVVSSIIVERALGFIALFVFVLVSIVLSIFVFGQSFFTGIWNLFWLMLILLVGLSALIAISLNETFLHRLVLLLEKRQINIRNTKIVNKLGEVYRSYRSYKDNMTQIGAFFVLSSVENLFPLLWTYSLSLAFGIEVPLLYFFILIPIVLVLVRLPISLDGIGIQEGAFVYFLTLIGVTRPEALLLGAASHIIAVLSVLPGGVLYMFSGLSFHGKVSEVDRKEISSVPADV